MDRIQSAREPSGDKHLGHAEEYEAIAHANPMISSRAMVK
jgi:hypothetical protein